MFYSAALRGTPHTRISRGVLFVGLDCEVNQLDLMFKNTGLETHSRMDAFTIQETRGTRATISRGIDRIKEMLPETNRVKREPVSTAHLVLGMECGGPDAYSGITANPAMGAAADLLVRLASNAPMFERLSYDMDINCGVIADGDASLEETGELIFKKILDTASGNPAKSETFGFGNNEFIPWHIGAVV